MHISTVNLSPGIPCVTAPTPRPRLAYTRLTSACCLKPPASSLLCSKLEFIVELEVVVKVVHQICEDAANIGQDEENQQMMMCQSLSVAFRWRIEALDSPTC